MRMIVAALMGCTALVSSASDDSPIIGHTGGGAIERPRVHDATCGCILHDHRRAAQSMADANARELVLPMPARGTVRYPFYPMAGTIYADVFRTNFVDLDPGPGLLDFACTELTYNTHGGHDIDLRSFAEQDIGVPIFAALDGVCVARDDGHFDRETSLDIDAPANFVILDHGNGLRTWYWHMRNGSVLPQIGDSVEAGEQIGQVASSGFSSGPHLHFETQIDGVVIEPNVGVCNAGPSMWEENIPVRRDVYLRDFGIFRGLISDIGYPGPPEPYPRSKSVTFEDQFVSYWVSGHNMPQGASWRIMFFEPDGTLHFDTGNNSFGFATRDIPSWWSFWAYNIPTMRTLAGDWTFELFIDDELMVSAPITVVDTGLRGPENRAPGPIGVVFDPETPEPGDVLFARVQSDLLIDDPDYDLVSYRYAWYVDDVPVRSVTSAAMSDAIPASRYSEDSIIRVEVTPQDGTDDGPVAVLEIDLLEDRCVSDFDGDGDVDLTDFGTFGSAFNSTIGDKNYNAAADFDNDGDVDLTDFGAFGSRFNRTDCATNAR